VEIVAGMVAVALMVSFAWTGHAAASGGRDFLPRIAADALHLFATAIWPTGLLPLAMFLACARARGVEDGLDLAPTLRLVQRFSSVSLVIVGVLVATGLTNSYFMIGRFESLFTTTYGQVLCVKLLLFAAILGIAASNRYRIVPALSKISEAGTTSPLLRQLQRLVLAEFSLAVAVVAMVSVLGTTPPPQP
jgi:putative copper resistance protein D